MTSDRPNRPLALITGAARRVGRAIALELADAGCDIHFTYNTSADDARSLLAELESRAVRADATQLDLDDTGATEALARRLAADLPRLDILIHNASAYRPSPLDTLTADRALEDFRIHALSPLLLTRHLAPRLRASTLPGGGAVLAMLDMHVLDQPRPGYVSYNLSKAALAALVRSLAVDLAPDVRVNAIAPGVIEWPDHGPESEPAAQTAYLERVPLARPGTPRDAATTARFLALDAPYITGHTIYLDAGRSLT